MTAEQQILFYKINKDKCHHTISWDCPECGLDASTLMKDDINVIGWTMIEKSPYSKEFFALVFECPVCFSLVSSHADNVISRIKKKFGIK
jgi:ribosomal protein S27AE